MKNDKPKIKNLSETRLEWLLKQRGFSFVDEDNLEKKICVKSKRPDYFAWRDNISVLIEVKEFKAAGPLDNDYRCGVVAVNEIIKRFARPLEEAAKQLKPYKKLGFAHIVVFDNHHRVGVPTSPMEVIQVFGIIQWRILFDRNVGKAEDQGWIHGPKQLISPNQKRYISAIAINLPKAGYAHDEPPNIERPMRMKIVHNPYAEYPLKKGLFTDIEDEHYALIEGKWLNLKTQKPLL